MQETFRANFDPKSQRLYLIGDPVPFGYLYLVRDGSDWLATYGIMEERRGEGHGTTLVLLSQALLRRIKIWVARSNGRARRIYERLGFVAVAGDLWNQQMVWNRRTP
jgi:GNAT superfamily N-acetyltransferase